MCEEAVKNYIAQFPTEGETPLFSYICRLYVSDKEAGNGVIQILKNEKTEICRVLMRKNKTFELLLNHFITLDIYLFPLELRWICNDFSSENSEVKDVKIVFPKGFDGNKFRNAFNEGRRLADKVINKEQSTTYYETLQEIIKFSSSNEDDECCDDTLNAGIKQFIAEDDFFKLPLKVINRVLRKSGIFFSVPEAKRFMFLADKEHPGESITLLQNLRVNDLSKDAAIEILSTISKCPLLLALGANDDAPHLTKADEDNIKAAKEMVKDEVIFAGLANVEMKEKISFDGECVVMITKNSENYKMVFVSTENKSVVDQHVILNTHHLFPNYHQWTAYGTVYMVKFQKSQNNIDREFEAAQYKAKYNIR